MDNEKDYFEKSIAELIPGDIILQPLYRADGLLLITRYKKMSRDLIELIKKHIPNNLMISVSRNENKYNSNTRFDILTHNNNNNIDDEINKSHNLFVDFLSNYPLWNNLSNKLESAKLKERAEIIKINILQLIEENESVNSLLVSMKSYDDILLIHSINVALLSLNIGLTLELSLDELLDLALAALFSNIGFTKFPKKEFKRFLMSERTALKPIKAHFELFNQLTSSSPLLRKKSIIFGILDHHEHYDGSGYPIGKKGTQISLYGRIIMIAHNYDELVGGYNNKRTFLPVHAIGHIYEDNYSKYDKDIINIFIHRTTHFKLDAIINIKNNIKAKIIDFEDFVHSPHLPTIELTSGKIINMKNSSISQI
ncbi:HD-GYP domain-containing protein [Clostridiisalibacter paucivorans]|uniref:HD-GYP domain-containing protein n=1 Tax=Clostridiisalibacter paucivorans TaxID=408753 RepID=UPI00047AB32E|nr:HD domain-containing phosphohydrolase [Clostridiisalibacter paucivorans]